MKSRWILLSAFMGIVAAILFILAYKIRTPVWIIGTIIFVVTFLFFIFRNPEFWYRRMTAALVFAWITLSVVPLTSVNTAISNIFHMDVKFQHPSPLYHIGFMFIIALLVTADFFMRRLAVQSNAAQTQVAHATLPKQEKAETVNKVRETVKAVIERSSITAKQKAKLLDDIDFMVNQITYHMRGGVKQKVKFLTPLNTAVRPPVQFAWAVNENSTGQKQEPGYSFRLCIRDENNNDKIALETNTNDPNYKLTTRTAKKLKPDTWYIWDIAVFDENKTLIHESNSSGTAQRKNRFKIFAQDDILAPIVKELEQDTASDDPLSHAALALILDAFELRDEALASVEKALAIDPRYAYAKKIKQKIHRLQGISEGMSKAGERSRTRG